MSTSSLPVPPNALEKSTSKVAKENALPISLRHFAHSLPGFTEGSDVRQRIEPWSFKQLLDHQYPVNIPLFQRKYCWGKAQGDKWWADLLQMKLSNCVRGAWHGVGKVVFLVNEVDGIMCIDGQQRTTTTSLLVSSIRDRVLVELRGRSSSKNEHTTKVTNALKSILDQLNGYLFMDPVAALTWCEEVVTKLNSTTTTIVPNDLLLDSVLQDGILLPFSRLRPSHIDRQPYFQCIMRGLLEDACSNSAAAQPKPNVNWGPLTDESLQGQMKLLFDEKVATYFGLQLDEYLQKQDSSQTRDTVLLAWTEALLTKSLEGMSFVYVEMLNEVNLAQVFLFLQEKTLFGMGAFLRNDAPGLDFQASDMARNLLLAPTMNWPLSIQEQLHMQHWVRPIEGCYRRPDDIDKVLKAFLADDEEQRRKLWNAQVSRKKEATEEMLDPFMAEISGVTPTKKPSLKPPAPKSWEVAKQQSRRYVSDMEKQVLEMIDMITTKKVGKYKSIDGMLLYIRFYSYYEGELLKAWKDKQADADLMRTSSTQAIDSENKDDVNTSFTTKLTPQEEVEWALDIKVLAGLASKAKELKEAEMV